MVPLPFCYLHQSILSSSQWSRRNPGTFVKLHLEEVVSDPFSETCTGENSGLYSPRKALNVSGTVVFSVKLWGRKIRNVQWSLLHYLNVNGLNSSSLCLVGWLVLMSSEWREDAWAPFRIDGSRIKKLVKLSWPLSGNWLNRFSKLKLEKPPYLSSWEKLPIVLQVTPAVAASAHWFHCFSSDCWVT